jgi:peptidoglycan pentaglycine glycine transferase (the first glycine)
MPGPLRRVILDDRRRTAWEALVRSEPACGFMQSLTWAAFQRRQGIGVYPRAWARDGRLEGGALFYAARSLDGPGLLATPGGPVVPWSDPGRAKPLFAALAAEARRLMRGTGSLLWRIEPRLPAPLPDYVRGFVRAPVDLDPFETREIDLRGGFDAVLGRMTPKGRYNVGLARRHGVAVTIDTDPSVARPLHALLVETAARQGFAAEPLAYLFDLAATLFADGLAAAFFASYEGEVQAAALATFYGPRATYLYGAGRRAHGRVMAGYAVQAAILAEAVRRGCTTYDLYGVDADGRREHPYHRLSQFKRRFGGAVRVYAGAHDRYDYDLVAEAMIPFFRHIDAAKETPC